MNPDYKTYPHTPPHLFVSNSKYFITSSTLGKYRYLKSEDAKQITLIYLLKSFHHFNWIIEDWVILDNHIHLMADAPENASTLSKVMANFHRFTANWLSKNNIKKVKVKYFHNYWDTCITFESSYIARLNYIWYNPVKHGYVKHAQDWKFGSYYHRINKNIELDKINVIQNSFSFDKVNIKDDF